MAGLEDRRSTQCDRPQWSPGALAVTAAAAHEDPDPWPGVVLDGRYELLDRIGQGGVASVYRARERGLIQRDVAIKLLTLASSNNHDTVARFSNEAQLVAGIRHPNVVQIFHVDRAANGQLYIVMELLTGQNLLETLQDLAAEGEAIPWRRLAPMMLQVCAALHAAHAHGVIHRDIKPNNCFRVALPGAPDFIKVLDFGIAKAERPLSLADSPQGPLTLPDRFVGTPHYAAPELIDPRQGWPTDGRVDVFAVGVMMYQCLTGDLPYADLPDRAVLYNTLYEPPPRPRERAPTRRITPEVDDLVARAMARHPDDRFPDIAALAAAIRGASAERTLVTVGTIDDPPTTTTRRAAVARRTGATVEPPRADPARRIPGDRRRSTTDDPPTADPAHRIPGDRRRSTTDDPPTADPATSLRVPIERRLGVTVDPPDPTTHSRHADAPVDPLADDDPATSRRVPLEHLDAPVDPPTDDADTTLRRAHPRAATRRVDSLGADNTPRSTLHPAHAAPITEPVLPLAEDPPPRDSRAVLVTYGFMGLCLLALLALLAREVTRDHKPPPIQIEAPPDVPRTVGVRTVPDDPREAPTTPTTPSPATPEILLDDDDAAAPPPIQFEAPTAFDRRRRKIADVAQELASARHILKCQIDVTRPWRLPLVVSVGPTGKLLRASASPRAPRELRLADEQQTCLLAILEDLSFPRGPDIQTVPTTVRGGPP